MERDNIIKALECSLEENYCATCPAAYYCGGVDNLTENALSLIKELTEERDGFENLIHTMSEIENRMSETIEELTEENERLRGCVKSKEEVEAIMRATYEPLVKEITKEQIDKAVADTVREMQKEIEARCIKGGIYPAFVKSTINQIAEEMIGEGNKERSEE